MSNHIEIAENRLPETVVKPERPSRSTLINTINKAYSWLEQEALPLENKLNNGEGLNPQEKRLLLGYYTTREGIKLATGQTELPPINPVSQNIEYGHFVNQFPNPYAKTEDPTSYHTYEGIPAEHLMEELRRQRDIEGISILEASSFHLTNLLGTDKKKARIAQDAFIRSEGEKGLTKEETEYDNWINAADALDNRLIIIIPPKTRPAAVPITIVPENLGCVIPGAGLIQRVIDTISRIKLPEDTRNKWGILYPPADFRTSQEKAGVKTNQPESQPARSDVAKKEDKGTNRWRGCLKAPLVIPLACLGLSILALFPQCGEKKPEESFSTTPSLEAPKYSQWGEYLSRFSTIDPQDLEEITGRGLPAELKVLEKTITYQRLNGWPMEPTEEVFNTAVLGVAEALGVAVVYNGYDWYKSQTTGKSTDETRKIDPRFDDNREIIDANITKKNKTPDYPQFIAGLKAVAK